MKSVWYSTYRIKRTLKTPQAVTETQVGTLATRSVDQEELIYKEQEVNIFPNRELSI